MKKFKEILYEEAKNIGIELTEDKLEKFELYKELLKQWNEKMNLTAISDDYGIIMKHFIDSLEIVKYINKEDNIIDIGTGAGFPGIVIAIFFENVKITLLDALGKRLIFLQEVIDKLNLKNVQLVHARAEELACKEEYRAKYDVAVSRAVAQLNILLELDSPYIKMNGRCLLMKGDNASEEVRISKNAIKTLNLELLSIHEYCYEYGEDTYQRRIVEIKKTGNTNNKYPRMFSKIKKNPL